VHDHDGYVFVGAGNVGIVVRQLNLFAHRCAIPFEAGEAALRHGGESTEIFACSFLGSQQISGWLMLLTQVEQER